MKIQTIVPIVLIVLVPSLGSAGSHDHGMKSGITPDGYVYQQDFMPKETVEINLEETAILITDPQNDFISKQKS